MGCGRRLGGSMYLISLLEYVLNFNLTRNMYLKEKSDDHN